MLTADEDGIRVDWLRSYRVLDTPAEPAIDRITRLLANICAAPVALVSLIDDERQWFKSICGLDLAFTDRSISFCNQTIEQEGAFIVEDAQADPRFQNNPLVRGEPFVRFYAGMPLRSSNGMALGTLAVIDHVPRQLDAVQLEALQTLAAQVMAHLDARRQYRILEEAMAQRERTQAALRDSEARWRLMFERNPLPMWVYDRETLRFLAVNDAAIVGYGWSHDEFLAMSIKDIRPGEDLPALMQELAEGWSGLHLAQRWRHRRKDGRIIDVEITAHSINFDGRPSRLVLANDVSQKVAAEQAVRDSEAHWRRLFDASATGIASCAPDGRFTGANPAFCALTGHSEAELKKLDFLAITHPAERDACAVDIQRLLCGEVDKVHVDKRFVRPDGSAVWARSTVSLMNAGNPLQLQMVAAVQDIDEQVRDQQRRAQNHALIALAGRLVRLGGWAVDLADGSVRWSDELRLILAVAPDETPNVQEALQWYVEPSRSRITQALNACLEHGTPFDEELELVTRTHEALCVRVVGQAVRNEAGQIVGAQGGLLDQTQAKQLERRLLQSEERFRNVARATVDAIWDWDLSQDTVWWSEGLHALFGLQDLVPGAQSWRDRVHPDDLARVQTGLHQVIEGAPERWTAEYRFRRHSGDYATVVDRGFILRDAEGRAVRMLGGMTDVSAQRIADARIREQAALLDEARDAIVVRDMDNRVTFWNRSAERIFGWHAEEALGRSVADLIREDPLTLETARAALLNRGEWSALLTHSRKDGTPVTMDARWTLLRDATGQPSAVLAIKTDVTQRLELERQLQQAQRLEALGQLTGGVAHDFNNLLTVILGSADMLAERLAADAELRPLAELARAAAERGAELTQRLLAFARKQALQPQAVDTWRLLADMDTLLRRTLPEDIDIELVRAAGLWPALVDPAQLEAAVLNLVLNARDAMPDGGKITLEVMNTWIDEAYAQAHADVLPGQFVMISVSDTGTGMTPDQLARAFEPFYTTKETGKGTGLGLSMVYGFLKQSRGHVNLYSEPDQGTTVRLYLPRADSAPAQATAWPSANADFRGTARVLIVEDDAMVRQQAERVLVSLGYQVLTAEDGRAALAVLHSRDDIDLLFTDVVMPGGLNGRQLADAAAKLRPRLTVLFTSGYTENAIVHHGRLDRGVQLLSKPYRSIDLARKVHAVLAAQRT